MVIGCSFDSPAENRRFAQKYAFEFPIVSDTQRLIGMAYGAARHPEDAFASRIAYVIGPDGRIVEAHPKVNAGTYPREQLERLRSAKTSEQKGHQPDDTVAE